MPLAWRRRKPLASLVVVMSSLPLLMLALADVKTVNFPQLVLFIPPYSVAAYAPRRPAVLGLAYSGLVLVANNLLQPSGGDASRVFTAGGMRRSRGASVASCGPAARRRPSSSTPPRCSPPSRVVGSCSRLPSSAPASPASSRRSIAHSVSAMIVQTQTAQRLLDDHPDEADAAMATIEDSRPTRAG